MELNALRQKHEAERPAEPGAQSCSERGRGKPEDPTPGGRTAPRGESRPNAALGDEMREERGRLLKQHDEESATARPPNAIARPNTLGSSPHSTRPGRRQRPRFAAAPRWTSQLRTLRDECDRLSQSCETEASERRPAVEPLKAETGGDPGRAQYRTGTGL